MTRKARDGRGGGARVRSGARSGLRDRDGTGTGMRGKNGTGGTGDSGEGRRVTGRGGPAGLGRAWVSLFVPPPSDEAQAGSRALLGEGSKGAGKKGILGRVRGLEKGF